MIENPVGFRVKIQCDEIRDYEKIKNWLSDYRKQFNAIEVKISSRVTDVHAYQMVAAIMASQFDNNCSIHLPGKIKTITRDNISEINNLINKLPNFYLITHLDPFITYEDDLKEIQNENKLLLENPSGIKNINSYFDFIDNILHKYNLALCLDIGHLMFDSLHNKIAINETLDHLSKRKSIIDAVKLIHLHDANINKDHLNLGKGVMPISIVTNFIKNKLKDVPIILEVSLNNLKDDGMDELSSLYRYF